MLEYVLALIVLVVLVGILTLSVIAGRLYGKYQIAKNPGGQPEVVIVAEGAVFTLLALLIAFSFSGAYERFETRKLHIIEEANNIDTAYKRIGLLAPQTQAGLRESFRRYVDSRLLLYKDIRHFGRFKKELAASLALEDQIWNQTLAAIKITNDASATQLFIPAVNDMFDTENTGITLTRIHPPQAIFELLIGLALLSGILAGYSTAGSTAKISLHLLCYVTITALTIFIIINLEFPRIGLIRIDAFDKILVPSPRSYAVKIKGP